MILLPCDKVCGTNGEMRIEDKSTKEGDKQRLNKRKRLLGLLVLSDDV